MIRRVMSMKELYQNQNRILSKLLLLLLTSCGSHPKQDIAQLLTNGSTKHWILVMAYPIKSYHGVSFNSNGSYRKYSVYGRGTRTKTIIDYIPNWKLLNDSTLLLGNEKTGVEYKIEYINEDILVLNNKERRETDVYKRAKDQKTEPMEDTADHSWDI